MSHLPEDLVEEILSRVQLKSLRRVRSTCKTWNAISKTLILGQKAIKKQFMAFMTVNNSVCLLRFELHGIRNENYHYDKQLADLNQISIPHHPHVKISQVFHCDGLLLCVPTDNSKLLLWNPYLGQTRWLRPIARDGYFSTRDMYAVGYEDDDDNNRNHKILRFSTRGTKYLMDVFDFRSASWRGFHVNSSLKVSLNKLFCYRKNVSLKGNTYFCGQEREEEETKNYLVCFDFTRERFGPRLNLPLPQLYVSLLFDVTLSNVGDEKLALLYYNHYELLSKKIVIWITTKIEPNEVSWTKFLTLDMKPHNVSMDEYWIYYNARSFFIDEDKKVAVLFDIVPNGGRRRCHMAYIIGEDGYFRSVNMGELLYPLRKSHRIVCSSYVPSLVQPQV